MSGSERISPTAHYTGYLWARNGLSHPELETREGRFLFASLRPAMTVSRVLRGPSLEPYLLARHRAIDVLLQRAIDHHDVSQVIELACGFSPRGWRFASRYGSRLTYVEADLPAMAARKRAALERSGTLGPHHRVEEVDALSDAGQASVGALAKSLDPERGLALITEGLLGYLDGDSVAGLWRRLAHTLSAFRTGRYFSDLHLGGGQAIEVRAFRLALSAFVRGRVHLHFEDAAQAQAALRDAGFASAAIHSASELAGGAGDAGRRLAHILEASTV